MMTKVRWSLAQRGVLGTIRVLTRRMTASGRPGDQLVQHPFDTLHGTDTSGLVFGAELATGHAHDAHITGYVGVPPSRFFAAMERWAETIGPLSAADYTFIDVGCGKGRAVLLASTLGFREVVGVELNPELARAASENLERWTKDGRALCPGRIVCADATEFALPAGPCLIFLFNPFGAPVMRRLLKQMEAGVLAGQGAIDVVYHNPEQAAVFGEFPALDLVWRDVFAMSEEDAVADPVSSPEDGCLGYRWRE